MSAKVEGGLGDSKVSGKADVLKGSVEVPLNSGEPIKAEGEFAEVKSGKISMSNSSSVGISSKIGPVSLSGSVDFGHAATGVAKLMEAGSEAICQKVDEIMNPQKQIP